MPDNRTLHQLSALETVAPAPMFLSSFFRSPEENFFSSESVTLDIVRDDLSVAIPLLNIAVGPRHISHDKYKSLEYTPPAYDEDATIHAYAQLQRQPGEDPFRDPNFLRSAGAQARSILSRMILRVRRSVELQAAQIFADCAIDLIDLNGTSIYASNFDADNVYSAHRADAAAEWAEDGSTGDPLGDIEALAEVVRTDSLREPTDLVFGASARKRFFTNSRVQEAFDKTRLNLGATAQQQRGGATLLGRLAIGESTFNLWAYSGKYAHPQTSSLTPYVATNQVLMICGEARRDLVWGATPNFTSPNQVEFLNGRLSDSGRQVDVQIRSWVEPGGRHLHVETQARPLCIPTEVASFASLDVDPA